MQRIMAPPRWPSAPQGFEEALHTWELDITEWERISSVPMDDSRKYAVMMDQAPRSLRIALALAQHRDSSSMKETLLGW